MGVGWGHRLCRDVCRDMGKLHLLKGAFAEVKWVNTVALSLVTMDANLS